VAQPSQQKGMGLCNNEIRGKEPPSFSDQPVADGKSSGMICISRVSERIDRRGVEQNMA